jgi:TAT (twin-arginine translocation) pathway signal sequence
MDVIEHAAVTPEGMSRRRVLRYGAVAGAAVAIGGTASSLASPAYADGVPDVLPAPRPIPGGTTLPDGTVIHVFVPGPPTVTLPFTGVQLQGLDVEPSVITDFTGFTALAYHVGTAIDSEGVRYNLETDMRVMKGTYRATDGTRKRGVFAFI